MGRDPLDTKLVALQEQAVHVRAQLGGVDAVRAALARLSADADQLIADLEAAEAAAMAAWVARDQAVTAQALAHRKSGELLEEVAGWSRLVRRCLAWVEPSWAVSRVREALPSYTNRFAPQPAFVRASVTALSVHAAALGVPERFDPVRAQGADLADRLDAHAAHLAGCAQRSTDASADLRAARNALLATCREVRAAWSAARVVDPAVPKLDLRIARAEAAVAARAQDAEPGPTQPPTDAPGSSPAGWPSDPARPDVSTPPSAPAGDPTVPAPCTIEAPPTHAPAEPEGTTSTVRVTTRVEVIEAVDIDRCERPDR